MSAWMCSKVHVDLMMKLALEGPKGVKRWEFVAYDWMGEQRRLYPQDSLGQLLGRENARSLRARYEDRAEDYIPPWAERGYVYEDPGITLTLAEAAKLLHCYQYQACESDDWHQTEAYAFCKALYRAILAETRWRSIQNPLNEWPLDAQHYEIDPIPGWHAAPWGWDEADVAKARALR